MKIQYPLFLALLSLAGGACASDEADINTVIHQFAKGIDSQDEQMLLATMRDDAALFATNPAGDGLIAISAKQFADLHGQKRFGGDNRQVFLVYLDIADRLLASATVRAINDRVHFTYYLGLTRIDGRWQIQTLLQRSKEAESD